MTTYIYKDELYHHGIKGQKWGIRRYQNDDGSLTPAGKQRYGIGEKIKNAFNNYKAHRIQRRIDKTTEYRDKIAGYAARNSRSNDQALARSKERYSDLKEHGSNSDTYKKYVEKEAKKAKESVYDVYEENDKSTDSLDAMIFANGASFARRKYLENPKVANLKVSELMDKESKSWKNYRANSKKWMETNKEIMSMEINEFTKKKDIKKIFNSSKGRSPEKTDFDD